VALVKGEKTMLVARETSLYCKKTEWGTEEWSIIISEEKYHSTVKICFSDRNEAESFDGMAFHGYECYSVDAAGAKRAAEEIAAIESLVKQKNMGGYIKALNDAGYNVREW
jgi:hypothetical protein